VSTRPHASPTACRDVRGFLAFSHGWTWTFWALATAWGVTVWQQPAVILFIVGGAGVFLGGLVMSRASYGSAGLPDLWRRLVDVGRIGARWWTVILLLYPALTLAASAAALALGVSDRPVDLHAAAAWLAEPHRLLAMMAFILVIGPLPEEIGWRGYLLDRLQLRWNALATSLLLGTIWWTWHLPLFVLPGYFDAFGRTAPTPLGFLVGIIPSAILYTWVYNNTRRSVLAVVVLHFVQNFTGEFLSFSDEARPLRLGLKVAAAVVVLWWWGPATLRRGAPVDRPPADAPASA
jgi:uncharacterized protein